MLWNNLFSRSVRTSSKRGHPFELKPQPTTSSRKWRLFGRSKASAVETTPQSTPENSPVHRFPQFVETPYVACTTRPVEVPQEYLFQRTNCVGGKNVPFTRRQVKAKARRARRYPSIPEEADLIDA
ncbi:hypothetical protein H310_02974 [Aphanomyces invadans]|uniref:Uncharacterized protein n=1 Tax=Aphanomyces invadans TaxID=157072 RepID=A0A024ULW0_9STRA|nr:hypothetical protein H310_02974 [Aphanomyces invadans]ETW06837.1 hypothetical protein H310_02974 [Aphanomyces invadans]|eukprot:XP_008864912.1 hypothetical protein H310_02974 [Aphanomyces invadans]